MVAYRSLARVVYRAGVAAALLTAALMLAAAPSARGCSCFPEYRIENIVGGAALAVVGTPVAREPVVVGPGDEPRDDVTIEVEQYVSGVGDGIEVLNVSTAVSSCGTPRLDLGRRQVILAYENGRDLWYSDWVCIQEISPDELVSLDLEPATPPRPGTVAFLAGIRDASAGLVALSLDGVPVGYLRTPGTITDISVCPGSEVFATWGGYELRVWRMVDFSMLWSVRVVDDPVPRTVECVTESGDRIVAWAEGWTGVASRELEFSPDGMRTEPTVGAVWVDPVTDARVADGYLTTPGGTDIAIPEGIEVGPGSMSLDSSRVGMLASSVTSVEKADRLVVFDLETGSIENIDLPPGDVWLDSSLWWADDATMAIALVDEVLWVDLLTGTIESQRYESGPHAASGEVMVRGVNSVDTLTRGSAAATLLDLPPLPGMRSVYSAAFVPDPQPGPGRVVDGFPLPGRKLDVSGSDVAPATTSTDAAPTDDVPNHPEATATVVEQEEPGSTERLATTDADRSGESVSSDWVIFAAGAGALVIVGAVLVHQRRRVQ